LSYYLKSNKPIIALNPIVRMKKKILSQFPKLLLFVFLTLTTCLFGQNIVVTGSGNNVADNAVTTFTANQTNFGSTNEASGTITKVFVITNPAPTTATLTIGTITLSGTNASDFTVTKSPASSVATLGTTTLEVTFNPSALGVRTARISFVTNVTGSNPFDFYIGGTGTSFPMQSYTLFYENFDANNGGWNATSSGGTQWLYGNNLFRGEGTFWSLGGNYSNNTNSTLTSPNIPTNGYINIKISFDLASSTEANFDGMRLEYSINTGSTWNRLCDFTENIGWQNSTNVAALSSSGFSGTLTSGVGSSFNEFIEKSVQFNDLDNKTNLLIRMVFSSNDSNTAKGIAIDNFFVKGDPITPFAAKPLNPGNVSSNLKLWLKANTGTSTTSDGGLLTAWNDQALDNNAIAIGSERPIYRDGTRNINFNSIVDFSSFTGTYMRGKGGFFAQDYYVVVKTNNTVSNTSTREVPISGRTSSSSYHLDGTAFALGDFTARYKDEMVSHSISSVPQAASTNSYGRAYVTTTETLIQETSIYNVKTNATGTSTEIYKNGKRIDNTDGQSVGSDQVTLTGLLNFSEFQNIQYNLGVGRFSLNGNVGSFLNGKLSEIISYSNPKTIAEKKRIESYLAIKNGVTLHDINSTTPTILGDTDYVDSSGNIIWNSLANDGFNYDIAGIGRDDNTALNQKQSRSENPNTVLTIGIGNVFATNNLNTNSFPNDRNFLIWGANGGDMNNTGTYFSVDLGPTTITTFTEVVNRRWKVIEVNGDVPTTRVSIPTTALISGLPPLGPTDAYVMVVATNAAFTMGVETVFMNTVGANQTLLYDFDNVKYITFGVAHRATSPLHITLDGFDDFVRVDNVNELTNDFSIMVWLRPNGNNTLNNERTIISKRTASTNGYQLVLQTDNKIRMEWHDAGGTKISIISTTALPNQKWHNIAFTYGSNTRKVYIDGVLDITNTTSQKSASTNGLFSIGGEYITKTDIRNLFRGDIDELRMWNKEVSQSEIQFIMNQEILSSGATGTIGTIIPSTVTKNDISTLSWNNLFAYYSMNSYIGTHLDDDSQNINRGSLVIPNKISINVQTAPMPYVSDTNGAWATNATWQSGASLDVPYSLSIINNTTPIAWNIVRTKNNVTSVGNLELLGLFVDNNTLSINNDTKLEVTHHLRVASKIKFAGKSQLLQRLNSDLDPTSPGNIERDQLGQKSMFNYNYWCSPVGTINSTTNNNTYTVSGVMRDGTTATPQTILWTSGLNGSPTTPAVTLSSYWIYKFQNLSPTYANWQYVGQNGSLNAGQGFTLKGSNTALANQNYTFLGKPNNGTITTPIAANNLILTGNPYSSALNATQFLNDNSVSTTRTIYFWQHYDSNNTHVTAAYQGGYATRNLTGSTPPIAPPGSSGLGSSTKIQNQYIAVGQGFFIVGSATGGNIVFNNNQREFTKEDNVTSNTIFKSAVGKASTSATTVNHFENNEDHQETPAAFSKLRLSFMGADTASRQILLGFMNENASSAIDLGYDAELLDSQNSDMYFLNSGKKLNISGEGFFNVDVVFPIGVKNAEQGMVSFKLDEKLNFDPNQQIFIHDLLLDSYTNLNTTTYNLILPQGTFDERFTLVFKNSASLGNQNFTSIDGIKMIYSNEQSSIAIQNNILDTTVEKVILYNMLGQQIADYSVENQNQSNIVIPIKVLSTGTYIVTMKTNKGTTSRKITTK
jgi:hypothetical protein